MTISERLFAVMEEKRIRPSYLADTLKISRSVVSTWRTRNTPPPTEHIVQICEILDVSLEFLLTGKESTDKKSPPALTVGEQKVLKAVAPLSDADRLLLAGALMQYYRQAESYSITGFLMPAKLEVKTAEVFARSSAHRGK